jgi:peptidoglycan hydrolase-like protein with peptidoglycan-binding domain
MMENEDIVVEAIEEDAVVEVVEEPKEDTWEPVSFAPLQRANYGATTQVRMSNIKLHADNDEMALVREALHDLYPKAVPPGRVYDYDVTRGIKKFQKSLGQPTTGQLTREQVAELGNNANAPFTVI